MTNINLDTLTQEELRDLQQKISEVLAAKKTIVPAGPLKNLDGVKESWYAHPFDKEAYRLSIGIAFEAAYTKLMAGLLFPYTDNGKLGATIRAELGVIPHPGIHWQEDVKRLAEAKKEWKMSFLTSTLAEKDLAAAVDDFLDKYAEGN